MSTRGFFGIGVYHAKYEENLGTLFRSAQSFEASFIFTIGRRYAVTAADTGKSPRHVPAYNYRDIDGLLGGLPMGCTLIGVELDDRARKLDAFIHPERACYLLGAEDVGLPPEVLSKCDVVVKIPYATRCLNVATAGSIVLYDRRVKERRIA